MTPRSHYSRMPGRSGLFVRNSLWMGADHLLSVRRNPFSESYRRYYFTDIQALVLTEFPSSAAPYLAALGAGLFTIAVALVYTRRLAWGILCGLVALLVLYLSWRLPTCACYLRTSVSTERLLSLGHLRAAEKAVATLKVEIEKVQGIASPEALLADSPAARTSGVARPGQQLRHSNGRMHWIAFTLLLLRGTLAVIPWVRVSSSVPVNAAVGSLGTAALLFLIFAAVQQRRSDMAQSVRRTVYAALAWYVASGVAAVAVSIYIGIQVGLSRVNAVMLTTTPAAKIYELVLLIGYLILGGAGLILMSRHQSAVRTPPPLVLGSGG